MFFSWSLVFSCFSLVLLFLVFFLFSCLSLVFLLFARGEINFSCYFSPKRFPLKFKADFSPFDHDAATITLSSTITTLTMTSNDKNLRLAYVLPLTQYSKNNFILSKRNVSDRNFKIVIFPFCLRQGSTNQYQTKTIPSKKHNNTALLINIKIKQDID